MRIDTVKTEVFKFNELDDNGKYHCLSVLHDINIHYDWWNNVYEDAKNIGLEIESFNDYECTGNFAHGQSETCAHSIETEHGEVCETYATAKDYLKSRDEAVDTAPRDEDGEFESEYDLDQELDAIDAEFLRSLLEDYRIMLMKEYEYLTSEEGIHETIEANEYEFTANGELYA